MPRLPLVGMEVEAGGVAGQPAVQPGGAPVRDVRAAGAEHPPAGQAAVQVDGPAVVVVREAGSGQPGPDPAGQPLRGLIAHRPSWQLRPLMRGVGQVTAEPVVPQPVLPQRGAVGAGNAERVHGQRLRVAGRLRLPQRVPRLAQHACRQPRGVVPQVLVLGHLRELGVRHRRLERPARAGAGHVRLVGSPHERLKLRLFAPGQQVRRVVPAGLVDDLRNGRRRLLRLRRPDGLRHGGLGHDGSPS